MTVRHAQGKVMFAVVGIVCMASVARADYYKYTDRSGAVCITNDPKNVPSRYRASMKVIREETLEKKDPGARKAVPPEQSQVPQPESAAPGAARPEASPAEPASTVGRLAAHYPWSKPLLFVAGIGVLFLVVAKLASLLPSPQLARLIYLVFFLGVFVTGYKLYADYMVNSYLTIKTKVIGMFIKANDRQVPEPGGKPPVAQNDELNKLMKQ